MSDSRFGVRTRGGLLVAIVFGVAVGFELRTVAGMILGVDFPAIPYLSAVLVVVAVVALWLDFRRGAGVSTGEVD